MHLDYAYSSELSVDDVYGSQSLLSALCHRCIIFREGRSTFLAHARFQSKRRDAKVDSTEENHCSPPYGLIPLERTVHTGTRVQQKF